MLRNSKRNGRRRPPWWFMPAVMSGLDATAALLSAARLTAAE